jgi:hypothetical protein
MDVYMFWEIFDPYVPTATISPPNERPEKAERA